MRRMLAVLVLALLMGPVTGSLVVKSEPTGWEAVDRDGLQWMPAGYSLEVPEQAKAAWLNDNTPWCCLLYTSPSPRDVEESRMPSSA